MRIFRKMTAALVSGAMIVSLAACGGQSTETTKASAESTAGTAQAETTAETAETSAAETEAETKEASDSAAKDPIEIATKPMTEQYILAEMLKILIEDSTDYTVNITQGIGGGTSNIQPAMEAGEFDLYPEYTSSGYVMVLGHDATGVSDDEIWETLVNEYHEKFGMTWIGEFDLYPEYTSSGYVMVLGHDATGVSDDEIWETLVNEYHEKFGMTWIGLYGFNNTYTTVVTSDAAEKYNLVTTSDLASAAGELTFGGNPDYLERADGFKVLCDTYGLEFGKVMDIDIGLKYQAMASGEIDVTNGYTTDAQLGSGNVVALEDDKHLQVNYFCSTVVREDTLEEYPGLEEALMKMDGILTDKDMASLNYKLEVEGMDEKQIAKDYLTEKGLIANE